MNNRIKEAIEYENKIASFFAEKGWNVLKEYKVNNYCFDIVLLHNGNPTGAVECKINPSVRFNYNQLVEKQWRIIKQSNLPIEFLILYVNNELCLYTEKGFTELLAIPTPETYKAILSCVPDATEKEPKQFKIENQEPKGTNREIYDGLLKTEDAQKMVEQIIKAINSSKEEILDRISEISDQVSRFRNLTGRQLSVFGDNTEVGDIIIDTFTDEIVELIQDKLKPSEGSDIFNRKELELRDIFNMSWYKLQSRTQNFLISARVMYTDMQKYGDAADWSGVCILCTKALECELKSRFYDKMLEFYQKTLHVEDFNAFPKGTTYGTGTGKRIKYSSEMTLEQILNMLKLESKDAYPNNENYQTRRNNYARFLSECLMQNLTEEQIAEKLDYYHAVVSYIKENFRNKSAHTGQVSQLDADNCLGMIINSSSINQNSMYIDLEEDCFSVLVQTEGLLKDLVDTCTA